MNNKLSDEWTTKIPQLLASAYILRTNAACCCHLDSVWCPFPINCINFQKREGSNHLNRWDVVIKCLANDNTFLPECQTWLYGSCDIANHTCNTPGQKGLTHSTLNLTDLFMAWVVFLFSVVGQIPWTLKQWVKRSLLFGLQGCWINSLTQLSQNCISVWESYQHLFSVSLENFQRTIHEHTFLLVALFPLIAGGPQVVTVVQFLP